MTNIYPFFDATEDIASIHTWLEEIFSFMVGFNIMRDQILPIPSWDMQALPSITLPIPSIYSEFSILGILPRILNDNGENSFYSGTQENIGVSIISSSKEILLERLAGGIFDDASYSDPDVERGNLLLKVSG